MRNVTVIPASLNKFSDVPLATTKKRKVAAYARVSTDDEDQQTSYAAQCDYYERYIKSREDWEFVGLYSDEGISGCNTKKREGFRSMVQDALDGKIELIIAKSLSRFSRNTVDSLTTIRKLKENGVEVWFEKENIWTFQARGEILLTILSSLSQEEARSISENVTWGLRKKFADGKFSVGYSRFLGYDKGEDGNLAINEEQAKTVRLIFGLFIEGLTPCAIAKCGGSFGAKVWHSTDKYRRVIYRCNNKYNGHKCQTTHVTEEEIKAAFVTAFNRLVTERAGANVASRSCASTSASCASEEIAANARLVRQTLCDTTELEQEKASLQQELAVLVEMTQNCIAENARIAQDQGEYQISSEPQDFPACESLMHSKRYNGLVERYEKAKARFDVVTEAIVQRSAKGERLRREASPFRGQGSSGRLRRRESLWRSSMSGSGARWWIM